MVIVNLRPFPRLVVMSKTWRYEARLWNLIIIASIVGFIAGGLIR